MENQFSVFKFFKGERKNPFNKTKEPTAFFFWFYEATFNQQFMQWEPYQWHDFFSGCGLEKEFVKIISEDDIPRIRLVKKKTLFDLWLEYLFTFKLCPEFGGKENKFKEDYFSYPAG